MTPASMNRSQGITSGSSDDATTTGIAQRGRGSPRSTQTSRAIRKNGATMKVFRSWIRFANSDAKAATTSRFETMSVIAAARNGAGEGSSRRASPVSSRSAAKGRTPR